MTFVSQSMRRHTLRAFAFAALFLAPSLLASCGTTEDAGTTGGGDDVAVQDDTGAIDTGSPTDTGNNPDTGSTGDTATGGDALPGDDAIDEDSSDSDTGEQDAQTGCPGASGCTCTTNFDCDNSICLDTPEGKRCATTCVDACDKGYTCQNIGTGDVVFVCVPDFLTLCSPCKTTKDCSEQGSASICLDYGDAGSFCGGPCKADSDCPEGGYTCAEVMNPETNKLTKQCKLAQVEGKQPVCGCSVWAKAAAIKTTCKVNNEFGTCGGERQCTDDGMGACSAKTPAEETCNGLDDDCNGNTDILPPSKTCSKSAWLPLGSQTPCKSNDECGEAGETCNPGKGLCQKLIGTCFGVAACSGGTEVCNDAKTPKTEACNGEDDDCDGNADEDFVWTNPASGATVPVGGACGLGPCSGGVVACETQLAAICTTDTKKKQNDTCNGVDDDCNGATDDAACEDGNACTADVCDAKNQSCSNDSAVDCDDSNPCTGDSCDPKDGGCKHAALTASCDDGNACTVGDTCEADAKAIAVCLPGATTKVCDDSNPCTDDSCDPKVGCVQLANAVTMDCYDGAEGTKGVGLCVGGTRACNNGKLDSTCVGQIVPNKVEVCDSKDDTCDGVTDEGCKATSVAGGFATASARLTSNGKVPNVHAVLGDGNIGGGKASAPGAKSLNAGFIAWIQSLFE